MKGECLKEEREKILFYKIKESLREGGGGL